MGWREERRVAMDALRMAARLCELVRTREAAKPRIKADRSPVTVADFGAQALVCRAIAAAFPGDRMVAEEEASDLDGDEGRALLGRATALVNEVLGTQMGAASSGGTPATRASDVRDWIAWRGGTANTSRCWTLDPIDGTKGFLRGDHYAIALALLEDGEPVLGVLACPALGPQRDGAGRRGALVEAIAGGGTRLHALFPESDRGALDTGVDEYEDEYEDLGGRTMHVASANEPAARRFVESVEGGHGDAARQEAVARAAGIDQPALRLDSQVKYAAVADGRAGLYLRLPNPRTPDYREKIWDHAAGAIVVREAGGCVTDIAGRPLAFGHGARLEHNRGIVAGMPEAHEAAIAALAAEGSETDIAGKDGRAGTARQSSNPVGSDLLSRESGKSTQQAISQSAEAAGHANDRARGRDISHEQGPAGDRG